MLHARSLPLASALLSAALASCVTDLHAPAKELVSLERGEARVFGSVEILVAPPDVEPARERSGGLLTLTGLASLTASDAAATDFEVQFAHENSAFHRSLELRPGAPHAYAAHLPEGVYHVRVTCSLTPDQSFELESPVYLNDGETLYLGRLSVLVPAHVGELGTLPVLGTRVSMPRQEDLDALGPEYRDVLAAAVARPLH